MRPYTSYFIYATPRSGSYLLCEALTNTGLAGNPTEYFGRNQIRTLWKREGCVNYADWLAKIKHMGTTPNGVFGAKVIWLNFEDLIDYLREVPGYEKLSVQTLLTTVFPNLHAIWIKRRDTVRQAVSYSKALQTQAWVELSNGDASGGRSQLVPEVTFDFQTIDRLARSLVKDEEEMQQYFTIWGIEPLTVVYEDFIQTYEETALRILDFLHITVPANLVFGKRVMQKQANMQSEEWVQRYYQLKQEQEVRL
jgi:trehalose 2-sulfotransferase